MKERIEEIIFRNHLEGYCFGNGKDTDKKVVIEELNQLINKSNREAVTRGFWEGVEMQKRTPLSNEQIAREKKADLQSLDKGEEGRELANELRKIKL